MAKDRRQGTLVESEESTIPEGPEPVVLPARRDWTLVVEGLEKKADATEKLADKAGDEGYHRAAREMRVDVAAIRERILPVLREQREIRFITHDTAIEAVTVLLHAELHRAVEASPRPSLTDIEDRVALLVTEFAEKVFDAGWALGHQARSDDVDTVLVMAADKARLEAHERQHGKQPGPGGPTS